MVIERIAFATLLLAAPLTSMSTSSMATSSTATDCVEGCRQAQDGHIDALRAWTAGPARYLLSAKEKKIADALVSGGDGVTAESVAAFRHWFWARRDPTPGTPANEFRDTFKNRVDYVNKELGDARSDAPGWRTPMGVAYLLLGPPTRRELRPGGRYGSADDATVDLWIYELDNGPVLEVPFVAADGRAVLLTTPENLGMRGRLDAALAQAAVDSIRNRELVFTGVAPLTAPAPVAPELPGSGVLSRRADGIAAQLSLPLGNLYGRPVGGDLRIDLRFELLTASRSERLPLGDLTMMIQPEDFERWGERQVTAAIWLPAAGPADEDISLIVTEVVSGRALRVSIDQASGPVAAAYPVAHLLGGAELRHCGGSAFAFIARPIGDPQLPDSLWVVRLPLSRARTGMIEEDTIGQLLLARR